MDQGPQRARCVTTAVQPKNEGSERANAPALELQPLPNPCERKREMTPHKYPIPPPESERRRPGLAPLLFVAALLAGLALLAPCDAGHASPSPAPAVTP